MNRVKLTNKRINDFLENPQTLTRQRLYDADVRRFYVQKLETGGYFYLAYKSPITYRVRYYPISRFADGDTCDQARDVAKKLQGLITSGEDPLDDKKSDKAKKAKTGRGYLADYYEAHQENNKAGAETIRTIKNFFPKLLDKPISELDSDDITRWQTKQKKTGIKFATIKRRYNAFKAMLTHAAKNKYITANPIKDVGLTSFPETEEQRETRFARRSFLEHDQMLSFLRALDDYQERKRAQRRSSRAHGKPDLSNLDGLEFVDHVKPIMLLMFYTGFRNGDAIGLRWEHVNFEFNLISKVIEKTAHKVDEVQHFPISPPLLDALKKWHEQNSRPSGGLAFPSPRTGNRLDKTALDAPWNNIRKFSGLPGEMQVYTLRHNFASHLVMDGHNLLSVAKLLGHSDVEMIVKHYGHLQPSHQRDVSERFASIVNRALETDPRYTPTNSLINPFI